MDYYLKGIPIRATPGENQFKKRTIFKNQKPQFYIKSPNPKSQNRPKPKYLLLRVFLDQGWYIPQ